MSASKHTPPPWFLADPVFTGGAVIVSHGDPEGSGDSIADVSPCGPWITAETVLANARLITAAPDLKDFAESIKIYTVEGDDDHLHVKINDRVVTVIPMRSPASSLWLDLEAQRKAVLAKANGGTP